jgi:hypothetical protein
VGLKKIKKTLRIASLESETGKEEFLNAKQDPYILTSLCFVCDVWKERGW